MTENGRRRAASAVTITVPSPCLRGEGNSVLRARTMGEGVVCRAPSPVRIRGQTIVPSPRKQGEGTKGDSAKHRIQRNAFTIARVGGSAKPGLWLFPVFVLFRPVIDGQFGRFKQRRPRGFLVCIPLFRRNRKRQVVPGRLFFSCYLQGNTGGAGVACAPCRSRLGTLPMPQCITTSRGVGGGAAEG